MLTRNDMKMIMNYLYTPACMLLLCAAVVSCSGKEIQRPDVVNPIYPVTEPEGTEGTIAEESLETSISYRGWSGDKSLSRPFASGTEANSVRIPSVVTAADGSLLVFCEARHNSWRDKSYTDIVVRRSTDNGKTWSAVQNLTGSANGGNYAFMDPVPVVAGNGEIFLFCCRWLKDNSDASNNRAFRLSSSDNGVTWSAPEDVTGEVIVPGCFSAGFGPGSGTRISGGQHAGRMILPSRQYDGSSSKGICIYSDDNGKTWNTSSEVRAGESQIADAGDGSLVMNIRAGSDRYASFSGDGGATWSSASKVADLPSLSGGCHSGVFGTGDGTVFWCGPAGTSSTADNDNRYALTLYRSITGAETWTMKHCLYDLASGYADMTSASDGRLVIVFESGPEKGFTRASGNRPAEWMCIDVIMIPGTVSDKGYWF